MSENDDFPHLAEERKAYRRNVAFTIAGVLLAATVFVIRMGVLRDKRRQREGIAALDRAYLDHADDLPALPPEPTAPVAPDRPPIELVVALAGREVDVDAAAWITLADGNKLEVTPRATRTFIGKDLSLRHPSSMRVVEQATILVTTPGATAELAVIDSDGDDAADLEDMAGNYTGTGQVSSDEKVERTLLGHPVTGRRLGAAGLVLELLTTPAGPHRRLRVVLTGTSASVDLQPLIDMIATVTTKKLAPTPELDAILRDAAGKELARAPATIGTPLRLGKGKLALTVRRRPLVHEQLSGMEFDHVPALSAVPLSIGLPVVQLRNGEIGIQVMTPPMAMSVDDLTSAMFSQQLHFGGDVTRSFDGEDLKGKAGEIAMGAIQLHVEVFAFMHHGRDFVVMLQYPDGAGDTAVKLAGPVVSSVK